jgi:hypothetical protein
MVAAKLLVVGALLGASGFAIGVVATKDDSRRPPLARQGVEAHALRVAWVAERARPTGMIAPAPTTVAAITTAPVVEPSDAKPASPLVHESVHDTAKPLPAVAPLPAFVPPPPHALGRVDVGDATPRSEPRKASSLIEETEMLRKAQDSMAAGDAAAALARLDELGTRHPDGVLREERMAARVAALCAAGRKDEAQREAARFLAETPRSIHAPKVTAPCPLR